MTAKSTNRIISWSTIVVTLLTAISTLGVVLLVGALALAVQPTLSYSQSVYEPTTSVVCPGDELVYTPVIHVARLPAMPTAARTWWSLDRQVTVIPDPELITVIWTENTPRTISTEVHVEVPELPAGRYELRNAVRSATIAVYSVPFTVPAGCA